jgi:putative membrane protein
MEADFSTAQRQSSIGILVMFVHTIQEYARAFWPILIIWVLRFNSQNKLLFFGGVAAIFAVLVIIAWLRYRNFTFFLDEQNEEFVITEGIFNKTKTVIQLQKIQQVNIGQSLLQRIIGVYALDVDTAGSNKKEGKIRAISHSLALALKARLLENDRRKSSVQAETVEKEETEEKPFIHISFPSLLKVGITSNYIRTIGVILAFFATIYENVRRVMETADLHTPNMEGLITGNVVAETAGIVILFILVAVLVVNVLRVVIRYFNFSITRQQGSLLLSFGLIDTKSTIIKPEKVQVTTVSQNYFQKKMDILELRIKQATGGQKEDRKSAIEIPGCNGRERDAILKLLFGVLPERGVMLKPNWRKLGFSIFLSIIIPLTIAYALIPVEVQREFLWAYPTYAILGLLILYFGYRNYRLFIHDRFIIKQSGAWDISNEIIEPHKIQALSVSQLFWHKSADIGYLTVHTAGGVLSFQLGNYTIIKQYVNQWLYEMETSDSNWM